MRTGNNTDGTFTDYSRGVVDQIILEHQDELKGMSEAHFTELRLLALEVSSTVERDMY